MGTDRILCVPRCFGGPTSRTIPENGAGESSGRKTCQHNLQISVIFWHLQGSSRVCTLHLYPLERVCGSNWPTIVGLSNSKYPEQVLLLGADRRLAYSCTRICGQPLGGSRVCTLLVYVWEGGCGSKRLTIVG